MKIENLDDGKNDEAILLKNMDKMLTKFPDFTPFPCGSYPQNRPLKEYIKYGMIHLDKSPNPSSHEVVTWIKNILKCEKTGHCGTLDPQVSGVLTICLDRATRLSKSQQNAGKEYVCVIEFEDEPNKEKFYRAVEKLTGLLYQRPPLMSAVKREIRLRNIYKIEVIEFNQELRKAIFMVACEAGTYIRTLCVHIGLLMGCGAFMKDLRRIRSGITTEYQCYTLHDLKDAMYLYENDGTEQYLRKIIRPLEELVVEYPRVIIKDSAVNAICYGAKLSVNGVFKYDKNIDVGTVFAIITLKGELVALGESLVSSTEIDMMTHGFIAKIKRVVMEKDLYFKNWGAKNLYEIVSN